METKRIRSTELKKDEYAFNALHAISGYETMNEDYSVEAVDHLYGDMKHKQMNEVQKEGELKAARDSAAEAEYMFHDAILHVKNNVRAQFGNESNELQSLGLKKKSERKAPKRKSKPVA